MQKLRLDRAKENKLQHSMALRIQVRGPIFVVHLTHTHFLVVSSTLLLTHVHMQLA
jgi:hypothetical protein